jgi:hypothetical protein
MIDWNQLKGANTVLFHLDEAFQRYLTMRPSEANKINIANIYKDKSCIASTDLILSRLYVTSIEGIRCVGNHVVSARYMIDVSASVNFPIKSPAALDKISSTTSEL